MNRDRAVWVLIGVLWGGYLLLDLFAVGGAVHTLIKGLLMPALLLWVIVVLRERTPRLLAAGLVLATVGDVGLEFDATFLLGMAGFLGMQICYIVGFLHLGAGSGIRRAWPRNLGFAAFWVLANVVLGPRLGELQIPIAVYSAALVTMAAVSAGVDRRVGLGGSLFLVSDLLIAFDLADLDFPARGMIVMVTYLAAQYLIATGWVRCVDPRVALPI